MVSILATITLLAVAGVSVSIGCVQEPLQADVKFDQLAGSWWQGYYSGESEFNDMLYYLQRIYKVDLEAGEFELETRIAARGRHLRYIQQETVNYNEEHGLKDLVMTDYDNYLIFFKCREGAATVEDVFLRKEISSLPLNKVKEVANTLAAVGVDFLSFEQREYSSAPSKSPK